MLKLDRITTIQYMGSKSRMLDSICMPIIKNKKIITVVDLFAGTGCVGFALSPYKAIISNDFEYYSYILNEAILNGCLITTQELNEVYDKIERCCQTSEKFLYTEIAAEEHFLSTPLDSYAEYA